MKTHTHTHTRRYKRKINTFRCANSRHKCSYHRWPTADHSSSSIIKRRANEIREPKKEKKRSI
jgi:hypothetical protein